MSIPAKPWSKKRLPKRILAIRMQAMGDVVITLPYLQDLRDSLPGSVQIDLLTRVETDPIPRNLKMFNRVYSIAGKRDFKKQIIYAALLLPLLMLRRYDIVLDLQNHKLSRIIRKTLRPFAWCEFDRTSPIAAGERTRLTIEAAGLGQNKAAEKITMKDNLNVKEILLSNGWDGKKKLVVLNPAGFFETRNWPLDYYVTFSKLWLKEFPETQFLISGLLFIKNKAAYLKEKLGNDLICLIGNTNPAEAFSMLQLAQLVVSEDSGMMHMSWVAGVPTFAIFGGSRSDKARPLGRHTDFIDSNDLSCGSCMQEKCKWGDNRCLTRYTPEFVFEKSKALLANLSGQSH